MLNAFIWSAGNLFVSGSSMVPSLAISSSTHQLFKSQILWGLEDIDEDDNADVCRSDICVLRANNKSKLLDLVISFIYFFARLSLYVDNTCGDCVVCQFLSPTCFHLYSSDQAVQ